MRTINIILSFFFCLTLQAQMRFKTERLKKIATHLPSKVLKEEQSLVKWSGCPQMLVKKADQEGVISHLGVYLFDETTRKPLQDHADFLERMMLELLLYKDDDRLKAKLGEHKMVWMLNGKSEAKPYASMKRFLSAYDISQVALHIDFSDKQWNIIESEIIWEPTTPIVKDTKMAEVFSYLKFGQPGAIKLNDNSILMSHWYADNGQYKTIATKIKIDME